MRYLFAFCVIAFSSTVFAANNQPASTLDAGLFGRRVVVKQPLFRPNTIVQRNVAPQAIILPQQVIVPQQSIIVPQQQSLIIVPR